MRKKSLFRKFFPYYLAIIVGSLLAAVWMTSRTVAHLFLHQIEADLESEARLLSSVMVQDPLPLEPTQADSLCKIWGALAHIRLTVIALNGEVWGDTEANPDTMENHADRPEIQQALAVGRGLAVRHSPTLGVRMIYVAMLCSRGGQPWAIIRAAKPQKSAEALLLEFYDDVALYILIIALAAILGTYLVSKRISKLLNQFKNGARRFAEGDLRHKLLIPDSAELGELAAILNQTAGQLADSMERLRSQSAMQEAILSSMAEGVIALDMQGRIISLNEAARELLNLFSKRSLPQPIQEVLINADLERFVADLLTHRQSREAEIQWQNRQKSLLVRGTLLRDAQGAEIGALLVCNDVTRLRQLENLRREFAANVSHELRTPITTIKGFVETLQDGAWQNPPEAQRFLQIISNHTDRLSALVEDVLSLSRLEQDFDAGGIELKRGSLIRVLHNAIASAFDKTTQKGIQIELNCGADVDLPINERLLEQAVFNLLDNAINYSGPGGKIEIGIETNPRESAILVRDYGCGMEAKHLPRLFERFYRVDKDRSRLHGGTGLGLAIVKHIALAHAGRVSVESTPGVGSAFRIHLPRAHPSERNAGSAN